jgi:hypothetical protein
VKSVALNLSLFKIAWLAVVFAAAASLAEVGTAVVALAVIVHLTRAARPTRELALLAVAAVVGGLWETFLLQENILQYPGFGSAAFAPYWIVAMWILFATTLNLGMRWLRKNYIFASLFGAIGGPLSFTAGEKAGAVAIADGGLIVIGIGWAILLPLMCFVAARFDGYESVVRNRQGEGAAA